MQGELSSEEAIQRLLYLIRNPLRRLWLFSLAYASVVVEELHIELVWFGRFGRWGRGK